MYLEMPCRQVLGFDDGFLLGPSLLSNVPISDDGNPSLGQIYVIKQG